ncbi:DUF3152 domain-containing protein [Streptomyces sp. NPDC028635]|uniref:DUF3152 domain-containing protein n=1 Tax=Streptomyces sp. NPDC028635 TaxID=3154800 RepID=UPI0033C0BD34
MGRHSRRGPAPKKAPGDTTTGATGEGSGASLPGAPTPGPRTQGARMPGQSGPGARTPGTRTPGAPTPGAAGAAGGTPARGVPRVSDGTPAHGVPRVPDGTPAHGVPRIPGGTPAHGVPRVRGGHPEQREAGGGWGDLTAPGAGPGAGRGRPAGPQVAGVPLPRQRKAPPAGPRQDYLDAFEGFDGDGDRDDVFVRPRTAPGRPADPSTAAAAGSTAAVAPPGARTPDAGLAPDDRPDRATGAKGGKGRTFTGIAAAAVTTVLAVVVAGQVAGGHGDGVHAQSATGQARDTRDSASRGDGRPNASVPVAPLTYEQKMARTYPLGATLKGPGTFDAVPGTDKAPGKGQKYTYRVDVEQGLGLDGALFAEAVQKTLNDPRSWAHGGARTFERVSSGKPDFVITLASPGTTATWCAKSGLDTTEDNVSCDSAATERVMINAYRWAQGSTTYGDQIHAYRQMLINHEVGHRLGHGHVSCDKDGALAPVMQQQTKFLDHDGIHCLPNPWPYPGK